MTATNRLERVLCCAALAAALMPGPAAAQEVENHIVLRVNNRIATLVDYQLRRDDRLRALAAADVPPDQREAYLEGLGEQVMGDMVEEMLLLSRADQLGLSAPRSAVEQEVQAARQRAGANNEAEFELALTRAGMTRDDLQQQIETNILVQQVIGREILGQIEITEEDLRRYYFDNAEEFTEPERRRVREFVLAEDAGSRERRLEAAERVLAAIGAGADPEQAVADEPLASAWIDVGLVERQDLSASLGDAAWALAEGEVSAPVEARGGLHVLQMTEVVPAQLVEFDQLRERIGQALQQERFAENYQDYMQDLRRDSYVQVNELPEDASDFDLEASAQRMTLTDLASESLVEGEAGSAEVDVPAAPDAPIGEVGEAASEDDAATAGNDAPAAEDEDRGD